jgi:hypothetical protein
MAPPIAHWRPDMRVLRVVCLLSLGLLSGGAALGQSAPAGKSSPAGKSPEEIQAIKERVADWLKTCLADWDRATHMTTVEWRTTCQRVAADRQKFLLEDPSSLSMGAKARPR